MYEDYEILFKNNKFQLKRNKLIEKLFESSYHLNKALDTIDYTKYSKKELVDEIKEQTYLSKFKLETQYKQFFPRNIIDTF